MDEKKNVDHIISLGSNCEITWNLRNYYGCERAYPFDWWITPYNSLIKLLQIRFEGLFDSHSLEVSSDLTTVRCKRFNILHHHDFQRDNVGKIIPDIGPQIKNLRDKYKFLINRFYKDCQSGRILFIRNRTGYDPHLLPDSDDIYEENIFKLYKTLEEIFPAAEIILMVTNVNKKGISEHGKIIWDEIINYLDADDYRVSPKGWTELFERQGFRLGYSK